MRADKVLHTFHGEVHANIHICQRRHTRFMRFGERGGWQGAISLNHPDVPVFAYQRAFQSLLPCITQMDRFLSFGVGTGTALRESLQRWPDGDHTGVELDSAVVDAAIAYFDSPSHQTVNYWIGDGVAFLCQEESPFDLIFVDAYMANAIYQPVLNPVFAHILRTSLTSSGVAVFNLITHIPFPAQVQAFIDACKKEFRTILTVSVGPLIPFADQNTLLVLTDEETPSLMTRWQSAIGNSHTLSAWQRFVWPKRMRSHTSLL